jgi:hypothetical protein
MSVNFKSLRLICIWLIAFSSSLNGQHSLLTQIKPLKRFLKDEFKNKHIAYCQNTGNAGAALIYTFYRNIQEHVVQNIHKLPPAYRPFFLVYITKPMGNGLGTSSPR